jgi:hypothetical protein
VFRRIEIIQHIPPEDYAALIQAVQRDTGEPESEVRRENPRDWKMGLIGTADSSAADAWIHMPNPRRAIGRNCRFYFTEAGWRRYGRPAVAACQRFGYDYRVIAVSGNTAIPTMAASTQISVYRPRLSRDRGQGKVGGCDLSR